MTVVLDTNALVQMFGQASPHAPLKRALLEGRLTLAVSTPMLLEYEEVICRLAGRARWEDVARMFTLISLLHGTIREVAPTYRFRTITADADDDAFADCAITAHADYLITEDQHFNVLRGSGYPVQPVTPAEFIRRHLTGAATPK
jgi:putative PIN family toxin of toxin-antitoxin system